MAWTKIIRKSAFSIVIERSAKFAASRDGTVMVYFEKAGKKEDKLIKKYFEELRSQGLPFNPNKSNKYSPMSSTQLSQLLRGIEGKPKSNPMIQLADLCLYSVAISRHKPNNQAFLTLKSSNRLADCFLQIHQLETLGIKYYCFDNS